MRILKTQQNFQITPQYFF